MRDDSIEDEWEKYFEEEAMGVYSSATESSELSSDVYALIFVSRRDGTTEERTGEDLIEEDFTVEE